MSGGPFPEGSFLVDYFETTDMGDGLFRIVDVLGNHCYLVVGEAQALLVDTCGGVGNLRACVEGLTRLPVRVALTHGHDDHLSGAYWYEEAYLSPLDGGPTCWELVEDHSTRIRQQIMEEGLVTDDTPFALRDGSRPRELPVADGDVFDLGGRTVRVVALPGHTAGSVAYLVEDCGVLLSGDAVTPDRGMEWEHNRLHEFRGIIHLCPCETFDADSVDFRAVIDHWHELPPRKRRKRRTA